MPIQARPRRPSWGPIQTEMMIAKSSQPSARDTPRSRRSQVLRILLAMDMDRALPSPELGAMIARSRGEVVPERSRKVEVTEQWSGRRADAWLALRFTRWSRTQMAREILAGRVRSNRRTLKPSSLLQLGETLEITIPGIAPPSGPPPPPPILHEDARLLVVNKPAGLLCHPAGERWEWGVIGLLRENRDESCIELGHRLDRDTSGVLVLTRDLEANTWIKEQLRHRAESLRKEYLAIVHGQPDWEECTVEAPIGLDEQSRVRLRRGVVEGGLDARTHFRVLRRLDHHCLVLCRLHTGRTHQIRIHLDHLGHALLGDRLYGQPDEVFLDWLEHLALRDTSSEPDNPYFAAVRKAVGFPRQALHAWRMQIPHPDGHFVRVEAPIPEDIQAVLDGAEPCWPCPTPANGQG
jgi:23S rRNA pseudouridine1911/1915/1917 synthase